ncbi:AAI [Musa troglodytarum]|uniref:AAI n=1 Tax=Musa troglodytarum TaxID=320322 RepID=A0A9E7HTS8_9LILI|nr:AAI [Musa troglodytarum]
MLWSGFGETHCRHDISLSFSAATNYPSPSSASTLLSAAADIPGGNCSFHCNHPGILQRRMPAQKQA